MAEGPVQPLQLLTTKNQLLNSFFPVITLPSLCVEFLILQEGASLTRYTELAVWVMLVWDNYG